MKEGRKLLNKKIIALGLVSLLLVACGDDNEPNTSEADLDNSTTTETEQQDPQDEDVIDDEEVAEEESFEEALEGIEADLDNPDEIPWDQIQLTQAQFDDFLNQFAEESDEDGEMLITNIDFDGSTIHIYLENEETDTDAAQFANSFFALVTDSFVRQFYLHSDYSNGETHPLIIIEDVNHGVVSELDDFVEFEE